MSKNSKEKLSTEIKVWSLQLIYTANSLSEFFSKIDFFNVIDELGQNFKFELKIFVSATNVTKVSDFYIFLSNFLQILKKRTFCRRTSWKNSWQNWKLASKSLVSASFSKTTKKIICKKQKFWNLAYFRVKVLRKTDCSKLRYWFSQYFEYLPGKICWYNFLN